MAATFPPMSEVEVSREKAVSVAVRDMSETMKILDKAMDDLVIQLAPVLSMEPPEREADSTKSEPRCELENQIVSQRDRVDGLVRRVRDLIGRLEV